MPFEDKSLYDVFYKNKLSKISDKQLDEYLLKIITFNFRRTHELSRDATLASLIAEKQHRENNRAAKRANFTSIIAICLSALALIITAFFSFSDFKDDALWKLSQETHLTKLTTSNNLLREEVQLLRESNNLLLKEVQIIQSQVSNDN